MAKTPEGEIKDQVRKVLDEMGAYYFFPAANGYGRTGIPDVIACVGGHFVGIECKAGSKQPQLCNNVSSITSRRQKEQV